LGTMLNLLLDSVSSDRAHLRALATEVIRVSDRERAAISRELHDSSAQQLAALVLQLSAAVRDCTDRELTKRLADARELAADALEEVRLIAHTMYPRVLDDLGLPAALENLARESQAHSGATIRVDADSNSRPITAPVRSVLYRVAQEAVQNAVRHAVARNVTVRLTVGDEEATLIVGDDGRGFDPADAERRRPGMGLFTMRERVVLVDGRLEVLSAPGAGTTVRATIPLARAQGEQDVR
jgi:signal transduction histidine kinase